MGYYVNPKNVSKEKWLSDNAGGDHISTTAPKWEKVPSSSLPVCLVDNFGFTAAAICYSPEELREFAREDGRPKVWCIVEIEKLKEVSDLPKSFPR
jgi:hypothetical protein